MYNGIGLQTARGSGTNGYVQKNLSAIRKTKEKVSDYREKEDNAVRPFDPELVEHDRRRQAELRCVELRDLLEEQELSEAEIDRKVNDFRAKLLAEKKLSYQRDASGRPVVKDSQAFSVAQEEKNVRAKEAFGIADDFIPGQSIKDKINMPKEGKDSLESQETVPLPLSRGKEKEKAVEKSDKDRGREREKAKKRKKSHKRSRHSSSSSSDSSDEEESHKSKKRKKEKKKKSKKSHRHR